MRRRTIRFLLPILALILVPVVLTARVKAGKKAPVFYLNTIDGERFNLKDLCGDQEGTEGLKRYHVILGFFNPRCAPCIRMIYELKKILEEHEFEKDVKVILINSDQLKEKKATPADLRVFASKHGVPFPILIDKFNIVTKIYGAQKELPAVFLIDRDGLVRFDSIGYDKELKAKLVLQISGVLAMER